VVRWWELGDAAAMIPLRPLGARLHRNRPISPPDDETSRKSSSPWSAPPQTLRTPVPDKYLGGGGGADDEVTRRRGADAQAPSAVRSRPRGPWDARRDRINPHRVHGGGYSPAPWASGAPGRGGIGTGGTVRWRCRHADVGRTRAPVRSSSCARMSQGACGLTACDRPRRVARPRHPRGEARAPRPSRRAPPPSGVGARLRGKSCHGSRQRPQPAVACGATKSRRPRDVVC
jgi:hypothetical protein